MCSQTTPPAEAYAPDADRAGPDAFAHPPEWLVHILAMLILFLLQHTQAMRLRRFRRTHAWWRDRPDLPAGSAQGHAASVRGPFGRSIAWMCRRHGIGPGHKDWPELSRAIVAFGGSLQGFCAGAPPSGLYWWENPGVVAGMVPFPSAPRASLLPPQAGTHVPPPAPIGIPAETAPILWPESWRQVPAPAGTGPPATTGPPGCPGQPTLSCLNARGRNTAGPAVLIRAERRRDHPQSERHSAPEQLARGAQVPLDAVVALAGYA